MNLDDIWSQFNWVINEMKEGMCFFEGYIPTLGQDDLQSPLSELIKKALTYSFNDSVWSNDTPEADWKREYSLFEYVRFFEANKILHLHLDYEFQAKTMTLNQKLIFIPDNSGLALEIICYREPILKSQNPKEAVLAAISEFQYLKRLFHGDALFIGPDTLDYPTSKTEYSSEWLRIE